MDGCPAVSRSLILPLFVVLVSACTGNPFREGAESTPPAASYPVACEVLGVDGLPLTEASCIFAFGNASRTLRVDGDGVARMDIEAGLSGRLRGVAEGHRGKSASFVVDGPKHVQMVLQPLAPGEPPDPEPTPTGPTPTGGPGQGPPVRGWGPVLTVDGSGADNEPHLAIDADGIIYYAPTSRLYTSRDGGLTFFEVFVTGALPTLGSDTSVSVAPDKSLWFARYWGYADSTLGCASSDRGQTWKCDNNAIPGATDRMWIVGLSKDQGFVQSNEGLYHNVWAKSTDGSTKYVPYGTTTTLFAIRNGNMVYDEKRQAVWQIQSIGGTQQLYRIDSGGGIISGSDTRIPQTYALPWISVHDGVLWTTGESNGHVFAARSLDGGKNWKKFQVSSAPESSTFSYVAAGPNGRAAVVYYGSDKAGASTNNGGTWSVYVAETDDALEPFPTWVESRVVEKVHVGNICVGLNCEQSGGDSYARFSGDLIGIAIDPEGFVHIAFNEDDNPNHRVQNQYMRQRLSS